MDNEERALSIFWLDGGSHPARAIALRNNISERELECELAIFKTTDAYRTQYEPVIRGEIATSLTNCRFQGWNKYLCIRQLPNQRIECIIAETRFSRKFYHAYIPDKEYVNNIFTHSFISWQQDFFRVAGIKNEFQWSTFPVEQQLNLLLDHYESEAFIPYRRLITEDETWIRSYTGFNVTPYTCPNQYNSQIPTQVGPATFRLTTPSSKALPSGTPESVTSFPEMTVQQMIEQKIAVWQDNYGTLIREPLSLTDLVILKEKASQKDIHRLEHLYTDGLTALTDSERKIFVHVDPFFRKYKLQEAVLSGSEFAFHSALDEALKNLADPLPLSASSLLPVERMERKEKFSGMLQVILNTRSTDIQKDIQVTNIRNLLNNCNNDLIFINDLWQILITKAASGTDQYITEIFYLMEEFGFYRSRSLPDPDSAEASSQSFENKNVPAPVLSAKNMEETIMDRRAQLLSGIAQVGTVEHLMEQLQETEDEIIRLPFNKRPAGYPEKSEILYQLYLSDRIQTLSEVCSLIIRDLSADQLATLCDNIPFS